MSSVGVQDTSSADSWLGGPEMQASCLTLTTLDKRPRTALQGSQGSRLERLTLLRRRIEGELCSPLG